MWIIYKLNTGASNAKRLSVHQCCCGNVPASSANQLCATELCGAVQNFLHQVRCSCAPSNLICSTDNEVGLSLWLQARLKTKHLIHADLHSCFVAQIQALRQPLRRFNAGRPPYRLSCIFVCLDVMPGSAGGHAPAGSSHPAAAQSQGPDVAQRIQNLFSNPPAGTRPYQPGSLNAQGAQQHPSAGGTGSAPARGWEARGQGQKLGNA